MATLICVLAAAVLYVFVSAAGTIAFVREDALRGEGSTSFAVIHLALGGYLVYRIASRLLAGAPPWPDRKHLVSGVLRGAARAWWVGLAALFALALARPIISGRPWHFDAYTVADVIGYAVVALVMSLPALAALSLARYLERRVSSAP